VQARFQHPSPLLGLSCPIFPPAGGEDVAEVALGAGLYQPVSLLIVAFLVKSL